MPMTSKQMIKLLTENGFKIERQKGSHVFLKNEESNRQVVVPYHNQDLKKGLEQSILKQAGLR